MFSGIVINKFKVVELNDSPGLRVLGIELNPELITKIKTSDSISVNGVCLTVSKILENTVFFDIMSETLEKTNLIKIQLNDFVNIELSLKYEDVIGGHLLSGHIDTTATLVDIKKPENNYIITIKVPEALTKYIFNKGYAGLNGCSLTVCDFDKDTFKVFLIPETLSLTNLEMLGVGDQINIEIDRQTQIIVETIERVLKENYISK